MFPTRNIPHTNNLCTSYRKAVIKMYNNIMNILRRYANHRNIIYLEDTPIWSHLRMSRGDLNDLLKDMSSMNMISIKETRRGYIYEVKILSK